MERAARRDDIDGSSPAAVTERFLPLLAVAWKNGVALGVIPARHHEPLCTLASGYRSTSGGCSTFWRQAKWITCDIGSAKAGRSSTSFPPACMRAWCAIATPIPIVHVSVSCRPAVAPPLVSFSIPRNSASISKPRSSVSAGTSRQFPCQTIPSASTRCFIPMICAVANFTASIPRNPLRPLGVARLAVDMMRGRFPEQRRCHRLCIRAKFTYISRSLKQPRELRHGWRVDALASETSH